MVPTFTELMGHLEVLQRDNMVLKYEKDGLKNDLDGLHQARTYD